MHLIVGFVVVCVVNCHLIPVVSLREQYNVFNKYKDTKTLLTSHNVPDFNDPINVIKEAKFEL